MSPFQRVGRVVGFAGPRATHAFGAVCRKPARRRLGGLPAAAGRLIQAAFVGPGPDGDPRIGAHLSARARCPRHRPCRSARCPLGAMGDGGGVKVRRPVCRRRRIVGRPASAGFHRDAAACGRRRAKRRFLLAGAAGRNREPQRRADALAAGKPAIAAPPARSASAGGGGVGRRTVPGAGVSARPLGRDV